MDKMPLVSIVMPTYQQVEFIEASIQSILSQDYKHIEIVVADGGSTDGTLDILANLSKLHPNITLSSQKDTGPAQAINRALLRSRGTIIGWLNSDDVYKQEAISKAVKKLTDEPNFIMVYGRGEFIDINGKHIGNYPTKKPNGVLDSFSNGCFICQPSAFFKRSMVTLIGPLKEDLKASFDYDYWLRAFKAFPNRIGFIDDYLAQARLHSGGISATMRRQVAIEGLKLSYEHLGKAAPHWATTYLEEVYSQPQKVRGFKDFTLHARDFLGEAAQYLEATEIKQITEAMHIYPNP